MKSEELLEVLLQTVLPGGIILNSLRGTIENSPKESDLPLGVADRTSTAHTIADDIVQEVALSILHFQCPNVRLNAEEDTPRVKLFEHNRNDLCYHLDPLDGTLSYVEGKNGFAIGAAFSRNTEFVASAIYFPAINRVFTATRGSGVSVQTGFGKTVPFNRRTPPGDLFLQKRSEKLLPLVEELGLTSFDAQGAHHGMLAIAEGRAKVLMYRFASPHDFGIPQVIVEEAGGVCTDLKGNTIAYDSQFNRVPWFFAFSDQDVKDAFFEKLSDLGFHT
ncbi:MAG: inositol monophosphatase family protein [Candidatus Hodarchaeota archaeon]